MCPSLVDVLQIKCAHALRTNSLQSGHPLSTSPSSVIGCHRHNRSIYGVPFVDARIALHELSSAAYGYSMRCIPGVRVESCSLYKMMIVSQVRDHARQLLEKRMRMPFFDARYSRGSQRMNRDELMHGLAWLDERFHIIRCEDDQLPSIEWVLDLARAAVMRSATRVLLQSDLFTTTLSGPGSPTVPV